MNLDLKEIVGAEEDFQMPAKLMEIMMDDEKREELMARIAAENQKEDIGESLTEYFENRQADRKDFMQDYTPPSVCTIVSRIIGRQGSILDICAGIGGLSAKAVGGGSIGAYYRCEETSKACIPFLLLNMAQRNARADIVEKDVLTGKEEERFSLYKGERFSVIEEKYSSAESMKFDAVIMNPPFSYKFNDIENYADDERFIYGLTPKAKSDWLFVECGLSELKNNGVLVAILPHGVLFRGQREGEIRKAIIEDNLLECVIGLPEKLFRNTDIPTIILVLRKGRREHGTLFIDASREYEHIKSKNILMDDHIEKIVNTYQTCDEIEGYSRVVHIGEIRENQYNLNIPRYINTYEKENIPSLTESMNELLEIDAEMEKSERNLLKMFKELCGRTPEDDEEIKTFTRMFERYVNKRHALKTQQLTLEDFSNESL